MMKKREKANGIQLFIRTVVKDSDGKVLSDTGQKPSKSFVIQFLEFFRALFDGLVNLLATDTDGAEKNIYISGWSVTTHLGIRAPAHDDDWGIVVGTGDTAETNTDYKLETQLTEGVGAGNITHGSVTVGTTGVVGANVDLEVKRAFTNNTGSTIIIKEAGVYCKHQDGATTPEWHCIVRDVLVASINVPDKCSLAVYYTFRTTV